MGPKISSELREIGSLHAIKELTKAGCGITFLYEVAVREELEKRELKVISLRNFGITHDFTFIWRRGSHLCRYLQRIIPPVFR